MADINVSDITHYIVNQIQLPIVTTQFIATQGKVCGSYSNIG